MSRYLFSFSISACSNLFSLHVGRVCAYRNARALGFPDFLDYFLHQRHWQARQFCSMMDYSRRGHPWPSGRFGYSRGLAVDGSEMDLSGRIIKLSELLFFFFF